MKIPLSPSLLIACAQGRLSGRTTFACTLNHDHRHAALRLPAPDDEAASMRFINGVGFWAYFDNSTGESSWPIPHVATVQQLARFGLQRGVLVPFPERGDLVLGWNRAVNRYTRAGIVVTILGWRGVPGEGIVRCATLDAHRTGAVARAELVSPMAGDRFLRWTRLVRGAHSSIPEAHAA